LILPLHFSNSGQTGTSGNTGSNQNVNQLIHDTKDLLTKAVGDINGRIFNLTIEFQRNADKDYKEQERPAIMFP
jgi:hypothetical protein